MNPTLEDLMCDGLSTFDLLNMTKIIREGYGTWYHANLLRCLHVLLPHADGENMARLEVAYPGSCAAYKLWYNDVEACARIAEGAAA